MVRGFGDRLDRVDSVLLARIVVGEDRHLVVAPVALDRTDAVDDPEHRVVEPALHTGPHVLNPDGDVPGAPPDGVRDVLGELKAGSRKRRPRPK